MKPRLFEIFSKKADEPIPAGPDFWLFPNIAGCYVVRRSPERWRVDGTIRSQYYDSSYVYSPGGYLIGEYSEITTHQGSVKSNVVTMNHFDDLDDEKDVRSNISLENSVRFCYLMSQGKKGFDLKREPFIHYGKNGMFAAIINEGKFKTGGYGIINGKSELVGILSLGEPAQYCPTGLMDVRDIVQPNGERAELRSFPDRNILWDVFRFIEKKEELYSKNGPGAEGLEMAMALKAKYRIR